VVAVNFWATWCGPCREEIPSLTRVLGDFEPRGFRIVGVSMDDGGDRAEKVRAFLKESKIRYPIAFPAGGVSQLSQGMDGLPTTLLFDRQGRVAKTYVGEVRQRVLRRDVEELLREQ
jgi:cytochrome c biogenesis protein CcmG/thiol:disulfide interchange protein DsbE